MDNCSNFTASQIKSNAITVLSLHSTTVAACATAVSLLLLSKTYKQFVYRLILYLQTVTAIHSITKICSIIPVLIPIEEGMDWFCTAFAFMAQAWETARLVAICLIVTYILLLSVFNYNANQTKHEVAGVLLVITVPILIDWLPFVWKRYGRSTMECAIQTNSYCSTDHGTGMGLSLGMEYGPILLTILYTAISAAVIVTVLCRDAINHELRWDQSTYHWGLKETTPLTPYPIIHTVISIIQVALCIYSTVHLLDHNPPNYTLWLFKDVVKGLGGLLVPVALFLSPLKELCKSDRRHVHSYQVAASSELSQSNEEEQLVTEGTNMALPRYQSIFEASRSTQ